MKALSIPLPPPRIQSTVTPQRMKSLKLSDLTKAKSCGACHWYQRAKCEHPTILRWRWEPVANELLSSRAATTGTIIRKIK